MGFFDSQETNERKAREKEQKMLEKYGLQGLTDPADVESVKKIVQELVGTGISEAGMKIGLTDPKFMLPITYQRAIMEQNFIIIRMLDRLIRQGAEGNNA